MNERSALDAFRASVRGVLLLPDDPGYDEARSVWNAMIDRRPGLILRCLGVSDVVAGVNFARDNGLPLSIKGGGHNIAGLAVCDDGLMLDLSLMRGVWVDPATQTAHAQGGCLLGDVDRETQLHGLATVLGFVSNTGIAGLTLGGGFGYLTRRFGWTCDNAQSMEVVTADGAVRRASETENPDLFWGLRGGGGNLGVVTNFEYKLYPVGPMVMGGLIAWRMEEARGVLEVCHDLMENAPPEVAIGALLRKAPPAPWLPKEVHGQPIIAVVACDTGPIEEGQQRLAALKSFGSPVGDIVQPRPYAVQQSLLDATQPKGRRYYWKSEYISKIVPELLDKAIEHAERIVSPHSAIGLFSLGTAQSAYPADYSAAGNRDATAILIIPGSWEQMADDQVNIEWVRNAWQDMRRFSTGGTYVNFLTEEEHGDRLRAAYGQNYARLVEVKSKWDPTNLFHMNKNIAPITRLAA